jgi:preprotein translocase subunit YajC
MSSSPFAIIFAQATNAATAAATTGTMGTDSSTAAGVTQPQAPFWTTYIYFIVFAAIFYFALLRPQSQAKKKAEETIKAAKTGDKVVTSSGIHGLITNVKDTTVIVKVHDNVKLEIEKSHIDKIVRPDAAAEPEKPAAKA